MFLVYVTGGERRECETQAWKQNLLVSHRDRPENWNRVKLRKNLYAAVPRRILYAFQR